MPERRVSCHAWDLCITGALVIAGACMGKSLPLQVVPHMIEGHAVRRSCVDLPARYSTLITSIPWLASCWACGLTFLMRDFNISCSLFRTRAAHALLATSRNRKHCTTHCAISLVGMRHSHSPALVVCPVACSEQGH